MNQKSLSAKVSLFSRWHHQRYNDVKVFDDYKAELFLTEEEITEIGFNMSKGISFFNSDFSGTEEEALRWIVDNYLSPSPIGRSAFCEKHLRNSIRFGAEQYLIFACGYDSFAFRQDKWSNNMNIFEMDLESMLDGKKQRLMKSSEELPNNLEMIPIDLNSKELSSQILKNNMFNNDKINFSSLLGITYYLEKKSFENLIKNIAEVVPKGSSIVFDYNDEKSYTNSAGERAKKQAMLAKAAGEDMIAGYSYSDIEKILEKHDFLIYEHLIPEEITDQYFKEYNAVNPHKKISAFDNVNYCLAVKK